MTATGANGKSMAIEVVDPELIALTGGIVQGMSGSPILQDGRLVGAVTHVSWETPRAGMESSLSPCSSKFPSGRERGGRRAGRSPLFFSNLFKFSRIDKIRQKQVYILEL